MLKRTIAAGVVEVYVPGEPRGERASGESPRGGHPPGEEDEEAKAQTLFEERDS